MRNKALASGKALLWGCLVILFPVASAVLSGVCRLGRVQTLLLQGGFMLLALLPPLCLLLRRGWTLRDLGFGGFDPRGCRRALYFLPLLAIYVPAAVWGFRIRSVPVALGSLWLYLLVGVAEEVYFRGIVPKYLERAFSQKGVIFLSTLIFGLGHLAGALSGGGALMAGLTVLNALLFGWLAMEVKLLSGSITVPIALHFLFDFETKVVALSGTGLLLAELARGTLLFFLALWLAFVLAKKDAPPVSAEQRIRRRKKRITALCVCASVLVVAGAAATGLTLYGQAQQRRIPGLSFADCLAYTLDGRADGVITVGVIRDGEATYTVYGEDGKPLPQALYTYEIGSMTKTFTAALVRQAEAEGKLRLEATLDTYLPLPEDHRYPTLAALLTHTSGYRGYYMELPMLQNKLAGRNDFCGVSGEMCLETLAGLDVQPKTDPFLYSNFGYAALGLVLEQVYGEEYAVLVNRFAASLGLEATHISACDLLNCWDWSGGDAYMAAGALTSNIADMLLYAQCQLDGTGVFGDCHAVLREIDATTADNALMGVRMDAIGSAWITDKDSGVIWHNGGTGGYNCYLGFQPQAGTAVVVLSNLPPSYRIPATVLGVKLLAELAP